MKTSSRLHAFGASILGALLMAHVGTGGKPVLLAHEPGHAPYTESNRQPAAVLAVMPGHCPGLLDHDPGQAPSLAREERAALDA